MAWSHANWRSSASFATTAMKIAELELHIAEVSLAIAPDVSSDSKSVNYANLVQYLNMLNNELARLQARSDAGGAVNGGTSLARFGRPL